MTPEIIAKHLTPAKRRALLWLPTEGGRERMKGDPSSGTLYGLRSVMKGDPTKQVVMFAILVQSKIGVTKDKGQIWPNTLWTLTPLGQKVRAFC
jgi:hypothetical protein